MACSALGPGLVVQVCGSGFSDKGSETRVYFRFRVVLLVVQWPWLALRSRQGTAQEKRVVVWGL